MMDLRQLYEETIQDHSRHPRNRRVIEHPTHMARGNNPLCGDQVTVFIELENDHVKDVSFQGQGCAISTASSSLMTEVLKGKTVEEATALFAQFRETVTSKDEPAAPEGPFQEELERLEPLNGVRKFPIRVKCATLSWHAFEAALKSGLGGDTVKTE